MKHVFSVHSPITFLAAFAVINNLNIDKNDVVILSNNYKVPFDDYKVFLSYSNIQPLWWQKMININSPLNEDKYISKITENEPFIAYIDIMSYGQAILATHCSCQQINFIEEGNSSYRKGDDFDTLTWSWYRKKHKFRLVSLNDRVKAILHALKWSIRGYGHRLLAIPYSFNSYAFMDGVQFYGFSELAFPDIPNERKNTLKLSSDNASIKKLAGDISLIDTFVWIDGSNSNYTHLSDEIYYEAIDKGIEFFLEELRDKNVWLKFRPNDTGSKKSYLYNALVNKGVEVFVLPDNMVLECVFLNSDNCKVIGNLSSALFYAAIFGHQSYSIYSLYSQKKPTIFDKMPGYWQMVNQL